MDTAAEGTLDGHVSRRAAAPRSAPRSSCDFGSVSTQAEWDTERHALTVVELARLRPAEHAATSCSADVDVVDLG